MNARVARVVPGATVPLLAGLDPRRSQGGPGWRVLAAAFGPGLTATALLLERSGPGRTTEHPPNGG
jgi:hypothetical protein